MNELFCGIGTGQVLILALSAFLIGINKTAVPGIGKKIAQRILLSLGRLAPPPSPSRPPDALACGAEPRRSPLAHRKS